MKINIGSGYDAVLLNFSSCERPFYGLATSELFKMTAGKHGFPKMRSSEIYIFRNMHDEFPRYLSEPNAEFISLHVDENKPLQFSYQLSHEISHLLAQNWKRHDGFHGKLWIEEALCGATSLFCIYEMAKHDGWWRHAVDNYFEDYFNIAYPEMNIDADWFTRCSVELSAATALTGSVKLVSRQIVDNFSDGSFISDNIKLDGLPVERDLRRHLENWEGICGPSSVPGFLLERFSGAI